MGKRKSSPRLATTSEAMLLTLFMSSCMQDIHKHSNFPDDVFLSSVLC